MKGKFCSYLDALDYSSELASEITSSDIYEADIEKVVDEYDFNPKLKEELIEDLREHCEFQIKQGVSEFISRFCQKMSTNLHGFVLLRAMGYVCRVDGDDGKQITSLRQIASHFNVSSQWVYKLETDLKEQLGVNDEDMTSLGIHRKEYSMKVEVPDGFMTIGQTLKRLKTSNKRLSKLVSENSIELTPHSRGSKLMRTEDVELLEKKIQSHKESITEGD